MFTLLSEESVFEAPKKAALYISFTVHVCALIALTSFSLFRVPKVRFELLTVHAGAPEPAREPHHLYAPIRNLTHTPSERVRPILPQIETPSAPGTDEDHSAGFTPKAVPSEFLALLDADTGAKPAVGVALAGTRTFPPLMVAEPSYSLPEPPPGKPDIPAPPVIGGRLEPA